MYFPKLGLDKSNITDTANYGLEINEKGHSALRFKFRKMNWKVVHSKTKKLLYVEKAWICIDLTLDENHIFTTGDARWLYTKNDIEQELKKFISQG